MSFLDTLKSLGLWQGQQQQAQQPNPYGLDPAMMQQARMSALGNIGGQLLALSQQMTPDQRARLMANADWTGGYQGSLYNAAQMQALGDSRKDKQLERDRMARARAMIADRIKAAPQGRARDAAMYFFEAGDLAKAGEILFKQERRFNPLTGQDEIVDYFDNPIGSAPSAVPPASSGGSGTPAASSSPAPGPSPIPPPDNAGTGAEQPVDQMTTNWRRILQDPTLTPTEVRIIASQGSQKGAYDKYAEIVKTRQTNMQSDRTAAEQLTSGYEAGTKSLDTVIQNGQRAAQVATNPNMSAADKLATLYQFMKTLDPDGAVREGDVAMAQAMQSLITQWEQFAQSQLSGGGPISDQIVLDMARSMARLANDAAGRKELKRLQLIKRAEGRNIPIDMVTDISGTSKNMPEPIGLRIPKAPTAQQNTPIPITAVRELQADPSPEARAEFDAVFGAGAAARVLGGQ